MILFCFPSTVFFFHRKFFRFGAQEKLSSHLDFTFPWSLFESRLESFLFANFDQKPSRLILRQISHTQTWIHDHSRAPNTNMDRRTKKAETQKTEILKKKTSGVKLKQSVLYAKIFHDCLKLPWMNVLREFIFPQKCIKRKLLRLKSFANKTI